MQNKQAIIGIVAAVVILLGAGGVFIYTQNKSPKPQPNSTTTTTEEKNTQSSMSGSLSSLLKSGKTQQCNFSYTDSDRSSTQGVAYIASDKIRTDLTINSKAKESNVYVIRNGNDNYIWGSEFPNGTGLKMTLAIDEFETSEDSKKYFDPTKKVDYECNSWTADSSVFVPPSNVKFSDLSQMMQAASSPSASNCSVCNSLTGETKRACLTQLGC